MDISMSVMNGIQVDVETPVVILTGASIEKAEKQALERGAAALLKRSSPSIALEKPYGVFCLLLMIHRHDDQ
jgi:CheY-like chemotaxis protein